MSRPRQSEPGAESVAGRLLAFLADREEHDATDLRHLLAASRGTLASALHALEHRYGYVVERRSTSGRASYRLVSVSRPLLRAGDLLTVLTVAGCEPLTDLRALDPRGDEWTLRGELTQRSA